MLNVELRYGTSLIVEVRLGVVEDDEKVGDIEEMLGQEFLPATIATFL